MSTQKSSQITKHPQHRHLIRDPMTPSRPLARPGQAFAEGQTPFAASQAAQVPTAKGEGGVGFSPSDAERGNPAGEGGVDLSAARRGIEQTAPFAPQVEPFINKPEVARRLNKTLRTVDDWMKRGILPHYKISRSVSFKWSEVAAHLAATCRVARSR